MRPGTSSVTPEELAELAKIPGNEGVRPPQPKGAGLRRVLVRIEPPEVPMAERVTLAVFVRTHDPQMADEVARAVIHKLGVRGEFVG